MIQLGVVRLEVDPEGDRHVRLLGRSGDDHLPRSRLEMLGGVGAVAEASARLDHDVDAEVAPGKQRGIGLHRRDDPAAVDDDRPVGNLDRPGERPVDGVVLEQLGEHRRLGDVVDRHPLDVGAGLVSGPEGGAAGSSEAVDGYADGHGSSLFEVSIRR